jgi:hypothetical protein
MATNYITRGPTGSPTNGDMYSDKTGNANLSAANWSAPADAAQSPQVRCPRAFVPFADGTLVFKGMSDSSDTTMYVLKGLTYSIAIKSITQASCSVALQITNALALLF